MSENEKSSASFRVRTISPISHVPSISSIPPNAFIPITQITAQPVRPKFERNISDVSALSLSTRTSSPRFDSSPIASYTQSERETEEREMQTKSREEDRQRELEEQRKQLDEIKKKYEEKIKRENEEREMQREMQRKSREEDRQRELEKQRKQWDEIKKKDEEKTKRENDAKDNFFIKYGSNPKTREVFRIALERQGKKIMENNKDTSIDWEALARELKLPVLTQNAGKKSRKHRKHRKHKKSRKHRKSRKQRKCKK
jgi:hypothetical protein